MTTLIPSHIHLNKKSQTLELHYHDAQFELSAEFLRVHSPSAEVKGHAGQGGSLPSGKQDVRIEKIAPSGNYAIKLIFNDGHDSGLYTWQYLHELATNQQVLWDKYLEKLHKANKSRQKDAQVINFEP